MYKKLTIALAAMATTAAYAGQTVVSSDITSNTTWGDNQPAEAEIILDGPIFVKNGATLTILPGTIVRGQPRSTTQNPGSLIVTTDGRIEAVGTNPSDGSFQAGVKGPIIFTTAAVDDGNGKPSISGTGYVRWTSGATFLDANPATAPLPPINPNYGAGENKAFTNSGYTLSQMKDNTELWGGLIILGEAPVNTGLSDGTANTVGNAYIEGLTNNADTLYGGTIVNDDSGSLRYVSVRHGGDQIGTANEINGITLGGVGAGTDISFCEVYSTYDDGFEWFGGTVNASYLMVSWVGDDSFDGDQGWCGSVQYAFTAQAAGILGVTGGDEACEFDGDDGTPSLSDGTTPRTIPEASYQFANMTIVGPRGASTWNNTVASAVDANGRITLRDGFAGALYNVYMSNYGTADGTGTPAHNASAFDWKATAHGPIVAQNFTLYGYSNTAFPTVSGVTVTSSGLFSAANNSGVYGLVGDDQASSNGLNPRPDVSNGGLATKGETSDLSLPASFADSKQDSPTYVGAFPTSTSNDLWTKGWTALNIRGILVD